MIWTYWMKRYVILAVMFALAMAACSGNDSTGTTAAPETMTIADLDTAILSAACDPVLHPRGTNANRPANCGDQT